MTYGLSADGFTAPRTADFLADIQTETNAELTSRGLPTISDFDADLLVGILAGVMAGRLGPVGDAMQADYDRLDRNNAQGVQLDSLGFLVDVLRNEATYSQATVTITGTVGVVIPSGSLIQGGGANDDQRWQTTSLVTIGSGGTVSVVVQALDKGAIAAAAGEIDQIITPVSGWTSVTNAADATAGQDRETDQDYRVRQQTAARAQRGSSTGALRSALLDLDYLTAVIVSEDTSARTISVTLWPSTLTTAQQQEVADTIWAYKPSGIPSLGSVTGTVTDRSGTSVTVKWSYASTLTVNVVTTITLEAGYALADVEDAVEEVVVDYFAALQVGDAVRYQGVGCAVAGVLGTTLSGVPGVATATVTLNGSPADVSPTTTQIAVLGTNTVTT